MLLKAFTLVGLGVHAVLSTLEHFTESEETKKNINYCKTFILVVVATVSVTSITKLIV